MKETIERVNSAHNTEEENINILFNLIQACRGDLCIIKFQYSKGLGKSIKKDSELVKIAQALARDVEDCFLEKS